MFLYKYPLAFVMNGEFWVFIFCIVSGYVLSKKKINTIKELLEQTIKRYLRFMIPLLFVNIFIALMSRLHLFYIADCGTMLENTWAMNKYTGTYSICDVLYNSFTLGKGLNPMFWVIRHMFLASIILYFVSYIENKFSKRAYKAIGIIISLLILSYAPTLFVGACLLGRYLSDIVTCISAKKTTRKMTIIHIIILIFVICMLSGVQNMIGEITSFEFVKISPYWEVLYAFVMLYCIGAVPTLKDTLSNKYMDLCSKYSMSLYLIHWPVISSFSAFMVMLMAKKIHFSVWYFSILLATSIIMILVLILYNNTVVKVETKITNKIMSLFHCMK